MVNQARCGLPLGCHLRRQVPADDPSGIRVHNNSQKHVHLRQTHVRYIGYPELVNSRGDQPPSDVKRHFEVMPAVGCLRDEAAFTNGEEVVFAHQACDLLMIDFPASRPRARVIRR
jgi:hypothetical protein